MCIVAAVVVCGRGAHTHEAAGQLRPRLPQFVASFENEDGRVFNEFGKVFSAKFRAEAH